MVHTCNSFSTPCSAWKGVLNFTDIIAPLHNFMERIYTLAGKRTKRAVASISLSSLNWNDVHQSVFEKCMSVLARQVTFAHRDTDKQLSIYNDTSDTVWSGVVFQISQWNMVKSHQEQRHEPVGFLSGCFNLTQLGWSVLEKKVYAVLSLFSRMHWVTATSPDFDFFTDHEHLVFLFDPLSIVPRHFTNYFAQSPLMGSASQYLQLHLHTHIRGSENA